MMDLQLREKVFAITGGSAGLGLALADLLVAEGARVAIFARDQDRINAAAKGLRERDPSALALAGDVTDPADSQRLVDAIAEKWGRLDGLVNNAGALSAGRFEEHTDDVWEADLALKLTGAVRLTRLALPLIHKAGGGAVLNTLSVTGKAPEALTTPTSVSRAAGLALTKALSRELAPEQIRVNAILIGVVESLQLEQRAQAAGMTAQEYYQRMVSDAKIPIGRVGQAQEYAALAAFLLSPRASYITGVGVNLDGGLCPVP